MLLITIGVAHWVIKIQSHQVTRLSFWNSTDCKHQVCLFLTQLRANASEQHLTLKYLVVASKTVQKWRQSCLSFTCTCVPWIILNTCWGHEPSGWQKANKYVGRGRKGGEEMELKIVSIIQMAAHSKFVKSWIKHQECLSELCCRYW